MNSVRKHDRTAILLAGALLVTLLLILKSAAGAACPDLPAFDLSTLRQEQSLTEWMQYLPDTERRLSPQSALRATDWSPLSVNRMGYLDYPVWTCLRLTNSSDHLLEAVLFNQRPMVQRMDISIWCDGRLIGRHDIGFFRSYPAKDTLISRLNNLVVHLPPGQTWTLVTRLETQGMMEAGWYAATLKRFIHENYVALLILGLYCGMMLALIVHGIISWASLGQPQFSYLVGYALCFMFYLTMINGMTLIVNIGLPPECCYIGVIAFLFAALVSWSAFTQYFLDSRKNLPTIHRCLNGFKLLFGVAVVIELCSPWITSANALLPVWTALSLILYATVLLAGMTAVHRRLPHAWLYLLGHAMAFTTAGLLAALMQSNFVNDLYHLLLIQPWIVIIHVSVMALSLGMLARNARADLIRERQLLVEQSRFAAVGKTIGMIVHQWRTPLARLGTQLMELDSYVRHSDPSPAQSALMREDLLPGMRRVMKTLKDTVDDFSDFFSARRSSDHFEPSRVVNLVLEMIQARRRELDVIISWTPPAQPVTLFGRPSTLAHVLMILLGNALDMLEARRVPKPQVALELEGNEREIVLAVTDNAGGIAVKPLERVFETFVSGKGEQHMGFGLAIAKRLVEERMRGTISAENIPGGARFTLRLPQSRPAGPNKAGPAGA